MVFKISRGIPVMSPAACGLVSGCALVSTGIVVLSNVDIEGSHYLNYLSNWSGSIFLFYRSISEISGSPNLIKLSPLVVLASSVVSIIIYLLGVDWRGARLDRLRENEGKSNSVAVLLGGALFAGLTILLMTLLESDFESAYRYSLAGIFSNAMANSTLGLCFFSSVFFSSIFIGVSAILFVVVQHIFLFFGRAK